MMLAFSLEITKKKAESWGNAYLFTVCWEDLKWNWKYFQQNLCSVKEHIHQIGSLTDSAQSKPIWLNCLAGGFYGHIIRISSKIYSKPMLHHALSPWEDPIESIDADLKTNINTSWLAIFKMLKFGIINFLKNFYTWFS